MRSLAVASLLGLTLAGCTSTEPNGTSPPPYDVTIRRTSYGIPHISAADLGSLAYGVGYAAAQDYGCYLADQMVKIKSLRARRRRTR